MSYIPSSIRRLELIISPAQAGIKVDTLLRKHLHLSGTLIRRVKCLPDGVLLDGARINTRCRPQAGQCLSVRLSDPSISSGILPVPGPLDIVYEDEDLLVVNKAAGVAVHPGPGHYDDTLGNFLLFYYQQQGIQADYHPIHRLDRGTSGLMVIAKHPHAQDLLRQQLHTQGFRRQYMAVCVGQPQPEIGIIDAPIGRAEDSLLEREVRPDGAPAVTHYQTLLGCPSCSLLLVRLETGRTHQIRVHLAHIGHPLMGDFLYGSEDPALIGRVALHSVHLELTHPLTGKYLSLSASLPQDMQSLLTHFEITPASDPEWLQGGLQPPGQPAHP